MLLAILLVIAVAVVSGFWYSYYQSLKKLRAHDQESLLILDAEIKRMKSVGASESSIAEAELKRDEFRTRHRLK